jgi:hypothetical protein
LFNPAVDAVNVARIVQLVFKKTILQQNPSTAIHKMDGVHIATKKTPGTFTHPDIGIFQGEVLATLGDEAMPLDV